MKKILYASAALILTAGVASAQVTFGGYGRFGIGYLENRGNVAAFEDTIIVSRFRLNIDANAESDGGVSFSGRIRLQADENQTGEANAASLNGARFTVRYGGLRVDVGNVSGAFDNMANYYGDEPGLENFVGQYSAVDYGFMGYSSTGSGSNGVYAQYDIGDFQIAGSYDSRDVGAVSADRWDVSATYSFSNITAAVAFGQADGVLNSDLLVLTLGATFGDLSGSILVGDETVSGAPGLSDTFYGVSGAYALASGTTIVASFGDGSGANDRQQIGVGVVQDLGGGVTLRGGIGQSKRGALPSRMQADFGARFNF